MLQAAMTVRMDRDIKEQFEELCDQFGMSINTAINIFVHAVVNTGSIPFEISKRTQKERYRRQAQKAFETLRSQAAERQDHEWTLDEINAEINAARREQATRTEL